MELLLGKRLFARDDPGATVAAVMAGQVPLPSSLRADINPELDEIVLRALNSQPAGRFDTAREMALALETVQPPAGMLRVGSWVERLAVDCNPPFTIEPGGLKRFKPQCL